MRVHELMSTPFVAELICDRCGTQARHDEGDGLNNFLQLGFDAAGDRPWAMERGWISIFATVV